MSNSVQPHGQQPTSLLCSQDSIDKNIGVGCHFLLPTKNKHKEKILKAAREKQQVTYKGNPICLTADLSAETLQAIWEWQDIRIEREKSTNKITIPGKDLIQN